MNLAQISVWTSEFCDSVTRSCANFVPSVKLENFRFTSWVRWTRNDSEWLGTDPWERCKCKLFDRRKQKKSRKRIDPESKGFQRLELQKANDEANEANEANVISNETWGVFFLIFGSNRVPVGVGCRSSAWQIWLEVEIWTWRSQFEQPVVGKC